MPYCEACGVQVSLNAKFCGSCGAPRNQAVQPAAETKPVSKPQPVIEPKPVAQPKPRLNYYSPPNMAYVPSAPMPIMGSQPVAQPMPQYSQSPPMMQSAPVMQPMPMQPQAQFTPQPQMMAQQMGGETTIGVVVFRRMKSLGRYDAFAGVATSQRMIFAQLTADMMNQAAQQARDQAKVDGKGFFGAWGDQLKATFRFAKRYLNIPPDAILAETPGNFAIYNNTVSEVVVRLRGQHENDGPREFEAEIKTSSGNFKYRMDEDKDSTNLLKQVYGDRVKMPFGYLGAVNIKFG
jgi:hypothetical protein